MPIILPYLKLTTPLCYNENGKVVETLNNTAENVALLYLMNQDTKSLSLEELYELYIKTVKQAKEHAKQRNQEKGDTFSFT